MMFLARPDTTSVHLLADLLETIGVAADELLDQKLEAQDLGVIRAMADTGIEAQLATLRRFIKHVRELELAIIVKVARARDRARSVARADWRLRPIMMLFTAGTQAFGEQLAAENKACKDGDRGQFDGAAQVFPYLRSRGLVTEFTSHYDGSADLVVTDSFRLMGVMPLRDLLERCEGTLNILDAHYDLSALNGGDADQGEDEDYIGSLAVIAEEETAPTEEQVADHPLMAQPTAEPMPDRDIEPAVAEIAAAQADSEAGLQSLTGKLAEMKQQNAAAKSEPDSEPVLAPMAKPSAA